MMKTIVPPTEKPSTVDLNTAIEQTKRFRNLINNPEDASLDQARLQSLYYCAEYFKKSDVQKLLDQDGCIGIRIYRGLDDDGKSILLMVGAGEDRDLLLLQTGRAADSSFDVAPSGVISSDENIRCPNMCNHEGLLNNP